VSANGRGARAPLAPALPPSLSVRSACIIMSHHHQHEEFDCRDDVLEGVRPFQSTRQDVLAPGPWLPNS
jgi:hypothetical protein